MKTTIGIIFGIIVSLMVARPSQTFRVMVDAYSEECFFERAQTGTKIGVTFEVIDGGFLDIDLEVIGANGIVFISRERENSGKAAFSAPEDGVYTFCFNNKMSTVTPKEIMFSISAGDPSDGVRMVEFGNYTIEENELIQPERFFAFAQDLKTKIYSVRSEQEYMAVRDNIHRRINESTNFRVVMWAFFEFLIVVALSAGQVIYIKRFFEVRRMV